VYDLELLTWLSCHITSYLQGYALSLILINLLEQSSFILGGINILTQKKHAQNTPKYIQECYFLLYKF